MTDRVLKILTAYPTLLHYSQHSLLNKNAESKLQNFPWPEVLLKKILFNKISGWGCGELRKRDFL